MDYKKQLALATPHLSQNDPILANLISAYGECTIKPHSDHYGELLDSIISQQLSVKAAATIQRRVLALFDDKMPSPEQLLAKDTELLRNAGLSYAKARYLKDLAEHIIDGRLDLTHIAALPNDELITQLTAVKGIGEWSAHMFMIFSLGRLDILPVGDLGVRKAIQNQYKLESLPLPATIAQIALDNNWAPYQSVAVWYLWRSLDNS